MDCAVIHYHGTPITCRRNGLARLEGKNFCVSFASPEDVDMCLKIGQTLMYDSGEFSAYTRGHHVNSLDYQVWLDDKLFHPHWALITDQIGGDEEAQRRLRREWYISDDLSVPVWHVHLSLDYLDELLDAYPRVAFGSSGEFWNLGTQLWCDRIDLAWNHIAKRNARHVPYVHMLRAMSLASKGPWPFASADSTNIARNWSKALKTTGLKVEQQADRVESVNPNRFCYLKGYRKEPWRTDAKVLARRGIHPDEKARAFMCRAA